MAQSLQHIVKPPWTGYKHSLHLFTQLLAAHPLTGTCRPPNLTMMEANRLAEQVGAGLEIPWTQCRLVRGRGWEEILAVFPNFRGTPCVWNPSRVEQLRNFGFKIAYIIGSRACLGNSQHNYAHWTKIQLPEGRYDLSFLEQIPGVLPLEVYAQATATDLMVQFRARPQSKNIGSRTGSAVRNSQHKHCRTY